VLVFSARSFCIPLPLCNFPLSFFNCRWRSEGPDTTSSRFEGGLFSIQRHTPESCSPSTKISGGRILRSSPATIASSPQNTPVYNHPSPPLRFFLPLSRVLAFPPPAPLKHILHLIFPPFLVPQPSGLIPAGNVKTLPGSDPSQSRIPGVQVPPPARGCPLCSQAAYLRSVPFDMAFPSGWLFPPCFPVHGRPSHQACRFRTPPPCLVGDFPPFWRPASFPKVFFMFLSFFPFVVVFSPPTSCSDHPPLFIGSHCLPRHSA